MNSSGYCARLLLHRFLASAALKQRYGCRTQTRVAFAVVPYGASATQISFETCTAYLYYHQDVWCVLLHLFRLRLCGTLEIDCTSEHIYSKRLGASMFACHFSVQTATAIMMQELAAVVATKGVATVRTMQCALNRLPQ